MVNKQWIKNLELKYNENKLAHSFLLETDSLEDCLADLKNFIKKIICLNKYDENCSYQCNNCELIDKDNFPNLIIVRPDGKNIKKEQVINIKNKFNKNPIICKYNIYIIVESDKLNDSAANAMLKFIEEPDSSTICFLISNNILNIMPTIKSRCQIIKCFYNEKSDKLNYEQELLTILNYIEKKDYKFIMYKEILQNIIENKNEMYIFFENMLEIYKSIYKYNIGLIDKLENYKSFSFLTNNDINNLLSKIKIINDTMQKLSFNVNIELLMDKFIIEMGKLNG